MVPVDQDQRSKLAYLTFIKKNCGDFFDFFVFYQFMPLSRVCRRHPFVVDLCYRHKSNRDLKPILFSSQRG